MIPRPPRPLNLSLLAKHRLLPSCKLDCRIPILSPGKNLIWKSSGVKSWIHRDRFSCVRPYVQVEWRACARNNICSAPWFLIRSDTAVSKIMRKVVIEENQENDIIYQTTDFAHFCKFFKYPNTSNLKLHHLLLVWTKFCISSTVPWHEKTNDQTREKLTFLIYSWLGKAIKC